MSVTDPLIKDIKGCVQQFLKDIDENRKISDNSFYFVLFCQTFEKILNNGLIIQQNTKYFNRYIDPYAWMASITNEKEYVNFAYTSSVDAVKSKYLRNNTARLRLLVKYCLTKKCLHIPIEFMMRSEKYPIFYQPNSILGDEILSEILLSVLYQIGKLDFCLDLDNYSFLDSSWYIPEMHSFELVPCRSLGISVSFTLDRAVIVNVESSGIVAETEKVNNGDVLDILNGIHISQSSKGSLLSIIRNCKGKPVRLTIVKAFSFETNDFFQPITLLLKKLSIDLEAIKKQYIDKVSSKDAEVQKRYGYQVTYLGHMEVGEEGSVKQVEKSLRLYLNTNNNTYHKENHSHITKINRKVLFEIGEIGVKLKDVDTNKVILEHSYMKISSCGSTPSLLHNFGYIAGSSTCDVESKFICYIFHSKSYDEIKLILQSIGQGFHRTHFAV